MSKMGSLFDAAMALRTLVDDLDDLIANSEGVAGLHVNGDIAPWRDLTMGGQYQEWLASLEAARETLSALDKAQEAHEDR